MSELKTIIKEIDRIEKEKENSEYNSKILSPVICLRIDLIKYGSEDRDYIFLNKEQADKLVAFLKEEEIKNIALCDEKLSQLYNQLKDI